MRKRRLPKLLGLTVLTVIGVLATAVTSAQAKYLLLLNGAAVSKLALSGEGGESFISAESGLKLKCLAGSASATMESVESGAKVTNSIKGTLTGCTWVGAEKTCIVNDGGAGLVHFQGTGEVIMNGEEYLATAASSEFAVIYTEGVFCTIPEEEILSGGSHVVILNASGNSTSKLAHLLTLNLWLVPADGTSVALLFTLTNASNPSATFSVQLAP